MTQEIIESALKNGIIIYNKIANSINGVITLVYLAQFNDYALCYGTNEKDAGYVLVSDFKRTWDLRVPLCNQSN